MCNGSNKKLSPSNMVMESGYQKKNDGDSCKFSLLLELSASDDLVVFRSKVEEKGFNIDEAGLWYGRIIGSKKMGFEQRTPLMIAAMFGSTKVLKYVIESGKVDVNDCCGSDRVTALHCATAGGSSSSFEVVKLLLDAYADANCVDANGNKPIDLIPPALKLPCSSGRKAVEMLLRGDNLVLEDDVVLNNQQKVSITQSTKEGNEKKEYPIDVSLPDINTGIYGEDEFRMYSFKVKPCSRAYSHDWTECPFVHPGENARRRDPRKYPYSCVPCPEFRKGTCQKADGCEYAHGVFESWLHPAQYRTRLCKDETGCNRKVCFFAHKPEELRPVYASTGSAMPSPRSPVVSSADMTMLSPLALGSSTMSLPTTSTPPMSPQAVSTSPNNANMWQNKLNITPPALQLPGSRLKSALSARDLDLEMEYLLGRENQANYHQKLWQQQLSNEISRLSSPACRSNDLGRIGELKPINLDDAFGSLDPSMLSPLHGLSLNPSTPTQIQSPTGLQIRQNMNQLRASYPSNNLPSSPVRKPSAFGFDSAGAVAAAVMNSRSSAFAKRSQSFIDRGGVNQLPGLTASANTPPMKSSNLLDWNSSDGKLDWGFQGDEMNKLKKSASFGFRNNNKGTTTLMPSTFEEPDVSWVNSLVKDVSSERSGHFDAQNKAVREMLPQWLEQMYIEQEQMVA